MTSIKKSPRFVEISWFPDRDFIALAASSLVLGWRKPATGSFSNALLPFLKGQDRFQPVRVPVQNTK